MNFNTFPGRYDNLHGDEDYQDYQDELKQQSTDDLMSLIADNGPDASYWIKELADTDALFHLVVIITKGRNKPEYRELLEALKTEIKGFL